MHKEKVNRKKKTTKIIFKFSQQNRYDNFQTQIGTLPQREYYNVMLPDYVNLNYDFIIWTSYIEQMNTLVEKVVYSDGAYWGDP